MRYNAMSTRAAGCIDDITRVCGCVVVVMHQDTRQPLKVGAHRPANRHGGCFVFHVGCSSRSNGHAGVSILANAQRCPSSSSNAIVWPVYFALAGCAAVIIINTKVVETRLLATSAPFALGEATCRVVGILYDWISSLLRRVPTFTFPVVRSVANPKLRLINWLGCTIMLYYSVFGGAGPVKIAMGSCCIVGWREFHAQRTILAQRILQTVIVVPRATQHQSATFLPLNAIGSKARSTECTSSFLGRAHRHLVESAKSLDHVPICDDRSVCAVTLEEPSQYLEHTRMVQPVLDGEAVHGTVQYKERERVCVCAKLWQSSRLHMPGIHIGFVYRGWSTLFSTSAHLHVLHRGHSIRVLRRLELDTNVDTT